MGHGIAQTAAHKGYNVVALESDAARVTKGIATINDSLLKLLKKQVEKGKLDAQKAEAEHAAAMARISGATDIQAISQCDLVIEAIVENLEIKKTFYQQLGTVVKPSGILASNTSSFPINELAVVSGRADKVCGLHFFNPVQLMQLVEVVRCPQTSAATFDAVMAFTTSIGKTGIPCKDTPGFVVNRLLVPYMAQALLMVDRADANPKDIDVAMRLGAGVPMGPIHLADYVGLDTCLSILEGWVQKYPNEPAFVIPKCLQEKVKAGQFGRKSGQGFYKWKGDKVLE
eukprot:TRINITY_DN40896_c0_g1_i1.p1 TRINITY_DN40896_c0_g1~~TRINITY_DN40896_c0_g1_i1.p1  ORF type:complete len:324 (-),score=60.22 TRINITY_DN40896_c0_g1_i1:32-889(-)